MRQPLLLSCVSRFCLSCLFLLLSHLLLHLVFHKKKKHVPVLPVLRRSYLLR